MITWPFAVPRAHQPVPTSAFGPTSAPPPPPPPPGPLPKDNRGRGRLRTAAPWASAVSSGWSLPTQEGVPPGGRRARQAARVEGMVYRQSPLHGGPCCRLITHLDYVWTLGLPPELGQPRVAPSLLVTSGVQS